MGKKTSKLGIFFAENRLKAHTQLFMVKLLALVRCSLNKINITFTFFVGID
jgi:hypothetical protein